MRTQRPTAIIAILLLGAVLASNAFAGPGGRTGGVAGARHWGGHAPAVPHQGYRGRAHIGPGIGAGLFLGLLLAAPLLYDPWRYYPNPYPFIVPSDPGMIAPEAPAPQAHWWYYCGSAGAYYPYVNACPEGWQKVPPQPPS